MLAGQLAFGETSSPIIIDNIRAFLNVNGIFTANIISVEININGLWQTLGGPIYSNRTILLPVSLGDRIRLSNMGFGGGAINYSLSGAQLERG